MGPVGYTVSAPIWLTADFQRKLERFKINRVQQLADAEVLIAKAFYGESMGERP
ncbi:MAG TPA: hypothetical protein PKM11_03355 [Methanomassiliicoccales archaeon]|nr:hypothetical protein [Methanomassiliicoccales archaeon]